MYAHAFQFLYHGLWIGPVGRVKFPISLMGPVEEIDDDNVNGKALPLVFPGHVQKLLLGLIAQLALPEAQPIFGHHGHGAGNGPVGLYQFGRGIAGYNPVIQRLGGESLKAGDVFSENRPADGGVVPQQPVSQGGNHKGNRGLGITVGKLQIRALQIQIGLLILAHAVDAFVGIEGLEPGCQMVISAWNGAEFPRLDF